MRNFAIALSIGLMAILSTGCETVPTGHVGVVDYYGELTGEVIPAGLTFMNPLKSVTPMNTQQMNFDFKGDRGHGSYGSIKAPARDKTTVVVDSTVIAYLNAADDAKRGDAAKVLDKLGATWYNKVIVPNHRSAVRDAVKEHDAMEAHTSARGLIADRTLELLTASVAKLLKQRGIDPGVVVIQSVKMRNIALPARIQKNIEAIQNQRAATLKEENAKETEVLQQERKLIAQQGQTAIKLEEADRKAEVRRIDAEGMATSRKIDASSIADYNRKINSSLSAQLLRLKAIEATRAVIGAKTTTTVFLDPKQPVMFTK